MFREETRQKLMQLAAAQPVPEVVVIEDSYSNRLRIRVDPHSGDISLSCSTESGVTFAGPGGGHYVPLVKEALRLLALAIEAESMA